jgi:hypothetical protein
VVIGRTEFGYSLAAEEGEAGDGLRQGFIVPELPFGNEAKFALVKLVA